LMLNKRRHPSVGKKRIDGNGEFHQMRKVFPLEELTRERIGGGKGKKSVSLRGCFAIGINRGGRIKEVGGKKLRVKGG